jgi:hypothetical protein
MNTPRSLDSLVYLGLARFSVNHFWFLVVYHWGILITPQIFDKFEIFLDVSSSRVKEGIKNLNSIHLNLQIVRNKMRAKQR